MKRVGTYWGQIPLNLKFMVLATALVIGVALTLTVITVEREKDEYEESLRDQATLLLDVLAHTTRESLYNLEVDELNAIASVVRSGENLTSVQIYSPNGTIIVNTRERGTTQSLSVSKLGASLVVSPLGTTYFDSQNGQLVAGRSIYVGRTLLGAVAVTFSTDPLTSQVNAVRVSSIAIASLLIILGVSIIYWLTRQITQPLRQLASAATQMSQGDFSIRVAPNASSPEVNKLAHTFNQMAEAVEERDRDQAELYTQLEQRMAEIDLARKRAEESDKVKSAFLSSTSHELRTPLNSVINFTKFVTRGVMGPINDRQKETLNKVIDSGEHLLSLINDVLDMSKIESGSLNLFVEDDIDLNQILETVAATAESLLTEKSVPLELDIDENLPIIRGDRKRITQILLNVVSNACKFTQEGFVKVRAEASNGEIRFTITDTGPGIEVNDQSAVFEAFKQTDAGLRQGDGTGLGMPISKSLAEAHGGRLWFESESGKGTTFYVTLPVHSESLELIAM